MVYLKYVENVIPLSSFIMDEKEAEARPVMGTIFLVMIIGERAKRARHSQVCSIENHDIYIIVRTYVTFAL